MGSSAQVVSVPELFEQGITKVPEAYIRFPRGLCSSNSSQDSIPVIDLCDVDTVDGKKRILGELRQACEEWGFFHVVNHKVPEEVMRGMMQAVCDFFELPMGVKMRYFSAEPKPNGTRYGVRFDDSRVSLDWRDFLDMGKCYPLTEDNLNTWPDAPSSFRDAAMKYCEQVRKLALELMCLMSESLGLEASRLEKSFPHIEQTLLSNRYLPCPEPHLVLGLRNHSDPSLITLLLPNEVPGLQVKKSDSSWLTVQPLPGSFIVNVGDQVQILTNKRFQSVEHRVLANTEQTRVSITSFFNPPRKVKFGPLPELVSDEHPPQYPALTFDDYISIYLAKKLSSKETLEALEA